MGVRKYIVPRSIRRQASYSGVVGDRASPGNEVVSSELAIAVVVVDAHVAPGFAMAAVVKVELVLGGRHHALPLVRHAPALGRRGRSV